MAERARPKISSRTLLVELGTEELPPKALSGLGAAFAGALYKYLQQQELISPGEPLPGYRWYATPRRLAASIPRVRTRQPEQHLERRGPTVEAAFDEQGQPTPAANGFAKSCGVSVEQLERQQTDQGVRLVYRESRPGGVLSEFLQDGIARAVKRLPIPKRMRWGAGEEEFVRPAHWLVVLHGSEVMDVKALSITSANRSRGHRFLADREISIRHANHYAGALKDKGKVIADFDERRALISEQVAGLASAAGGRIAPDPGLLDEVTALVEWPCAVLGEFDAAFLAVPHECLISAMRDHQKYFHVSDAAGRLLPKFITVSNIQAESMQRVRDGNQRVLHARLADARFFWESDRKRGLAALGEQLPRILFHERLGSVADKVARITRLAAAVAERIGADATLTARAAELCKNDLASDMVGEFPELQGAMGRHYAAHHGEPDAVIGAIEAHYRPRFAGDAPPQDGIGQALALADKIDTLTGIFAAGEEPGGDKDPYGLRRAALGVLRIAIEGRLNLDLAEMVQASAGIYRDQNTLSVDDQSIERLLTFIFNRLDAYYADSGIRADEIHAVMACRPTRPLDIDSRLRALSEFKTLAEAASLAAANKRISNILRKSDESIPDRTDGGLLNDPAEQELLSYLDRLEADTGESIDRRDYTGALKLLASLRDPVDRFFDQVMVMVDDPDIRLNRLSLLRRLHELFLQIADISLLQMRRERE